LYFPGVPGTSPGLPLFGAYERDEDFSVGTSSTFIFKEGSINILYELRLEILINHTKYFYR
jgi:hypothetical protein